MHQYNLKKDCLPCGFARQLGKEFLICRRLPKSCPDQTALHGIHYTCLQVETLMKDAEKEQKKAASRLKKATPRFMPYLRS